MKAYRDLLGLNITAKKGLKYFSTLSQRNTSVTWTRKRIYIYLFLQKYAVMINMPFDIELLKTGKQQGYIYPLLSGTLNAAYLVENILSSTL